MVTFIHAADIHLDSPLLGLIPDESSPDLAEIRGATRLALENLVSLALKENIPLLLISGDLYDGDWKDFGTGLFFVRQMQKLNRQNIQVIIVSGNHDAANTMTKSLPMPENVYIFNDQKPETFYLEDLKIAIHGQSYSSREVTDNLAINFPAPIDGYFNIGLLHCLISGSTGHKPYAPCTLEQLISKGYDYWALGHVHTYTQLHSSPPVIYPGCTQGRHIREQGAKGCVRVETEHTPPLIEFLPIDVLRWYGLELDISEHGSIDEILNSFKEIFLSTFNEVENMISCMRITLKGVTPLHGQLQVDSSTLLANLKATAGTLSNNRTFIEKLELQTKPVIDFKSLEKSDSPQGELLRYLNELEISKHSLEELGIDLNPLQSKLIGTGLTAEFKKMDLLSARDILLSLLSDMDEKENN